MNTGREESWRFLEETGELSDLSIWEGYEFWSTQLEAEMEAQAEGGQANKREQLARLVAGWKERKGDVLPF